MPANAPRRAKNVRCAADSSSKLQSIAARSVCCRSATSAAAVDEQPEAVLEARPDGRRAQHVGAGGGQLDGQRQAVERDAHRGDVGGHRVVDLEVR